MRKAGLQALTDDLCAGTAVHNKTKKELRNKALNVSVAFLKASERQTVLFPVTLRLLAWNTTISFHKASKRHFLLLVLCG